MINRYSLKFRDKGLENQYQEYQLYQKRKPLASTMIFLGVIYVITKGIIALLYLDKQEMFLSLAIGIGILALFLVVKVRPMLIRWAMMLSTYLFLLIYIQVDVRKTQFSYQLFSALIVALQIVFITSGEFIDAVIQLISIFSIYTVYYFTYIEKVDISTILSVFMLLFLLIASFYKNVAAERSKFQLTLIDNQWDQILASMITQPSLIFTFDVIQNTFIFKRSQDFICHLKTSLELKEFLRNSKLIKNKSISLENYIAQDIKQFRNENDKKINEKLYIEYQRKVEEINYSIFSGPSPVILIKVMRFQVVGENRQIQIDNNSQYKYLTLLKGLYQRLKKEYPFDNKNLNGIFKTVIFRNLIENLHKGLNTKIYSFNKVIKRLSQLYLDKQIYLKNMHTHQLVYCQKEVIFLTLIELFENIVSFIVMIEIEKVNDNEITEIKVEAEFNQKTIQTFNLRAKYLLGYFENVIIQEKCIRLQIKSIVDQKIAKPHFVFQF